MSLFLIQVRNKNHEVFKGFYAVSFVQKQLDRFNQVE